MPLAISVRRLAALVALTVLTAFAALAALSLRDSALADPPYPPQTGCALSAVSSGQNGTLSVTGSGFGANTSVTLRMGSNSLATVATDGNGGFQASVVAPASSGSHALTASAASSTCSTPTSGTAGETINRSTTSSSNASGTTASTGFQAITASAIAIALLGGGAMLVLVGRRRKTN